MATHTFRATLGKERPVVEVPLDVPAAFGGQRVPVKGTVNGTLFRTTIAVYGGRYYSGFNKRLRDEAGMLERAVIDFCLRAPTAHWDGRRNS